VIFVTVGTQLAFPRLLDAMEAWAGGAGERVAAQAGPDAGQGARWPHLEVAGHLSPEAFDALFGQARVVVAHAGIGTILSARRHARPLVILPRRAALGEHRNDHQMATARAVANLPGVHVAWEAGEIAALLARDLAPAGAGEAPERAALIARLRGFLGE
jgi:UDP-N-acetylglucosamine transferase subunit ALG13